MSDITFQDIKKAYAQKATPVQIKLCYSEKEVNLRPIRMKDKKDFLKVLESTNDTQIDTYIDKLIKTYVSDSEENPLEPASLVDEERRQLLVWLRRISTHAETVNIDHVCPKCNALKEDIVFPLTNIVVEYFKKPEDAENLIETKGGNVKFLIGQLTRQENLDINNYYTEAKIESSVEKEFITLAATIKEIYIVMDDISRKHVPSIAERVEFLGNLSLDDFEKINTYFSKCTPFGPKMVFDFKCSACDYANNKEEVKIVDFFIK